MKNIVKKYATLKLSMASTSPLMTEASWFVGPSGCGKSPLRTLQGLNQSPGATLRLWVRRKR
jgi:ABC-type sugar transport system ATPase subunit